jgi:hypothetical protein
LVGRKTRVCDDRQDGEDRQVGTVIVRSGQGTNLRSKLSE